MTIHVALAILIPIASGPQRAAKVDLDRILKAGMPVKQAESILEVEAFLPLSKNTQSRIHSYRSGSSARNVSRLFPDVVGEVEFTDEGQVSFMHKRQLLATDSLLPMSFRHAPLDMFLRKGMPMKEALDAIEGELVWPLGGSLNSWTSECVSQRYPKIKIYLTDSWGKLRSWHLSSDSSDGPRRISPSDR